MRLITDLVWVSSSASLPFAKELFQFEPMSNSLENSEVLVHLQFDLIYFSLLRYLYAHFTTDHFIFTFILRDDNYLSYEKKNWQWQFQREYMISEKRLKESIENKSFTWNASVSRTRTLEFEENSEVRVSFVHDSRTRPRKFVSEF